MVAKHLPLVLPGSVAIALLMVWGFDARLGTGSSIVWLIFVTTLAATRLWVVQRLARGLRDNGDYSRLQRFLLGGAFISGCVWGLGGLLFFHPHDAYDFALLVIILGGMVAGSLGPYSYFFPNYVAFAVPTLVPLIVTMFLQGSSFHSLVGIALIFFLLLNIYYSKQYEEMVLRSIRLQFSNRDLLERLQQSNRQLLRYSFTDALTGVGNRRQFDADYDAICERAWEQRRTLSLLLLDVDHFKSYNDEHGHPMGDEVLRKIAAILREVCENFEGCEQPSRIGGEEFAILLHGNEETAVRAAERLRQAIEQQLFDGGRGVTASLGVATWKPEEEGRPQELFLAADRNLYRAKAAGRNRVISG